MSAGPPGGTPADSVGWFGDASDAQKYLGEVSRLWACWLLGLVALVKRELPSILRFLPWVVIIASFVAAAWMALTWFEG